jgi:hypothetical protein
MAGRKGTRIAVDRPGLYDRVLHDKVIAYLRTGSYLETAAAAAGVSKPTLHNWLKRAAHGEERYAEFARDVEEAQALAELRDLALVGKAALNDWRAASWRLERRHPRRWGGVGQGRANAEADEAAKRADLPTVFCYFPKNDREVDDADD